MTLLSNCSHLSSKAGQLLSCY